ncbi:PqqD family peptide modification chaperone [Microbacterium sp. 1P10UB]|uniref:PqqD family peptide modification chaperone n=1 Tax=unclassified Microbacterium TaxID=2609290 RepID=UPI0039A2FFC2
MERYIVVSALGAPVRIDVSALDEDAVTAVRDAWADATIPGDGEGAPTVTASATASTTEMLSDLSQRVTLAAIDNARARRWMLHAAGLAREDGRVAALIGPSGRGKTTASRTLGRRFGYVSDETVAVDDDGTVHPYRKPLSIIENGVPHPKAQRAPHTLGLGDLPDVTLRLGAIVLLERRPDGPDEPEVEDVDLGDALAELVAQTSFLAALPRPLQTVASHAAAVGGIRRVTYREAETLDRAIRTILDAAHPGPAPVAVAPAPLPEPVDRAPGARYTRTDAVDAVQLDDPDRLVVLHTDEAGQGVVRVLSGLAPAIWRAAADATLEELVYAAVERYGEPEGMDAAAAVSTAVEDLLAEGVLRRADAVRWAVADDVAWVDEPDRSVVLRLSAEAAEPVTLEGSAAVIWDALVAGGPSGDDVAAITSRTAEAAGVDAPDDIAADVADFLAHLLDGGFIEARPIS